jgi:rubrerythrin
MNEQVKPDEIVELLRQAYAMEVEAADCYYDLSDQMFAGNNPDVANIFSHLADIEGRHADEIEGRLKALGHDAAGGSYSWDDPLGPESTASEDIHYLMTPYHALQLALHNEKRAAEFFRMLANKSSKAEAKALALEYAGEEDEHVKLVEEWLTRVDEPVVDWHDDEDPAVGH